ncbi:MAG TPA: tRNA dihydrouridine synthase DusB [Caulobacteraceae bacterium]|nr:tRNA dihydrouridine synthase DusB [Caulobacteraceae bacterium]
MSSGLRVGDVVVPGRVWLAPMTGVSDLAFRKIASALGAPYVATEMVAAEPLARGRPDVLRRAAVGDGLPLMVVQLVGRDPEWIAAGARAAVAAGAHIIDLNFSCPAKAVAGRLCGAALMREPERARALVEAAAEAAHRPVTVKMRLGWDEALRNAVEMALIAESAGAQALTIHARTRSQFYSGAADWEAVAAVKRAVSIPVIVNGDVLDVAGARQALARSGADAVMIGRGAIGRPWAAAEIDAGLQGQPFTAPAGEAVADIIGRQLRESLALYGERPGVRMFRKHLAAYVDHNGVGPAEARRQLRARLCRIDDSASLAPEIAHAFAPVWRLAA